MSDRKYASDYRIEEHITPSGVRETRRIYQGAYYRFSAGPKGIRSLGTSVIGASCGAIVALLPMLFNNTQIGRTAYVLLPIACALAPLYNVVAASIRMCRYPERLTRQQRDLTEGRLKTAAIWQVVLLGLSVLGCLAYVLLKEIQPGEILCMGGIVLSLLMSLWILCQQGRAKTEEITDL